jgi:ssDNA-binding Zn-finger/Zn-ribbon topoisomerase 1
MCEFCEEKAVLLTSRITMSQGWECSCEEDYDIMIRRGKYLSLGVHGDMNCIEHGDNVEINYCPKCGRKLGEE